MCIDELLTVNLGGAFSLDDKRIFPFHLEVLPGATFEVFAKLLSASPEAIDMADKSEKTIALLSRSLL